MDHKLLAFEKFLQNYPQWSSKVILILVTMPLPHDKHDANKHKLESQISDLVRTTPDYLFCFPLLLFVSFWFSLFLFVSLCVPVVTIPQLFFYFLISSIHSS